MSYHTRNAIPQEELKTGEQRAANQSAIILQFFRDNAWADFTPFEVATALEEKGHRWAITSIRRAITDLTVSGHLRKTNARRTGLYGQTNCTWTYNASLQASLFN